MAPFTCISFFTGYDGIGIGLRRVIPNLRTLCYVEREVFACANLVAKIQTGLMDDAPIWSDIKTFDCAPFAGNVDLIHGGYPCPGFSCAGQRRGKRDPRFLWPWVFRAVVAVRPRRVFFENVEGHLTLGLSTVISDLETANYRVEAGIFSAEECGASHRRKRVFILGELDHPESGRKLGVQRNLSGPENEDDASGQAGRIRNADDSGSAMENPRCPERRESQRRRCQPHGDDAGRNEAAGGFGEPGEAMANPERLRGSQPQGSVKEQRGRPVDRNEAMADTTSGARQRASQGRDGHAAQREQELADADKQGLEGWGLCGSGCPDERASRERERAILPAYPPGPNDAEGWARVLAVRPDLAPALTDEETQSAFRKLVDEPSGGMVIPRIDMLRLAGNGVVPSTAELAYRTLFRKLNL